jgi:hypothetical protein
VQNSTITITQVSNDLVLNEIRIENRCEISVWGHIAKDGDDIYAPQVLWPGAVRMEDLRSSLFLAMVTQSIGKGSRLEDEATQLTEVEIVEGGAAVVTGSRWEGYTIQVVAEKVSAASPPPSSSPLLSARPALPTSNASAYLLPPYVRRSGFRARVPSPASRCLRHVARWHEYSGACPLRRQGGDAARTRTSESVPRNGTVGALPHHCVRVPFCPPRSHG